MKEIIIISELMGRTHYEIMNLFNKFKKESEQDSELITQTFNRFKWELEKHLIIEEKAIFTSDMDDDDKEMIPDLIDDHKEILKRLDKIENDLNNKDKHTCIIAEIAGFQEIWVKHKDFEDKVVYPKLDKDLDESEKENIIKRIKENLLD